MLSFQLALSFTQFSALKQGAMLTVLSLCLSESSETIMTFPYRNDNGPTESRQSLFETLFLDNFRLHQDDN